MDEETHTDDLIVRYLLGSLPEEETERLDELGIVNDEFAARLELVENDLLDAYVRGELSGETLERFTSFYLASPRRREKVRFAQLFQRAPDLDLTVALAERGRRKEFESSTTPESRSRAGWLRGLFSIRRSALLWGAASLALLLAVAGLLTENRRLQKRVDQAQTDRSEIQRRERDLQTDLDGQRLEAAEREKELESLRDKIARLDQPRSQGERSSVTPPEQLMIVPVDLAPQTRGISRLASVSIPTAADLVTFQLELENGEYPVYRVELKSLSGAQIVWSGGGLKPRARDGRKVVVANVRARLLKPQRYVLEVFGISASGAAEIAGSYPFEVKRQ